MTRPRVAIVQDWFVASAGSEQVAMELSRILPTARVHTTFADRPTIEALGSRLATWPLQNVPGAIRRYRSLLPLYPLWFGSLQLHDVDLVVSSSPAFAKAVRTPRSAVHIAYIHAPMRYAWNVDGYLAGSSVGRFSRIAARSLAPWLRRWDVATSRRPTMLVANSTAVRERIRRYWGRDAEVIHPPVSIDDITAIDADDGYLLVIARLLAYRRIDILIHAVNRLGRPLVVVGDGPERARLQRMAGPSVRFTGHLDREAVVALIRRCHAYIVPGEEDFGMAPVEAMAAGKPVVAFGAGGALDTVVDGVTGLFFHRQDPTALADAIQSLDVAAFDPSRICAHAEGFSSGMFRRRFVELFRRLGVDPELYGAA